MYTINAVNHKYRNISHQEFCCGYGKSDCTYLEIWRGFVWGVSGMPSGRPAVLSGRQGRALEPNSMYLGLNRLNERSY